MNVKPIEINGNRLDLARPTPGTPRSKPPSTSG